MSDLINDWLDERRLRESIADLEQLWSWNILTPAGKQIVSGVLARLRALHRVDGDLPMPAEVQPIDGGAFTDHRERHRDA